jgi:hypothetical protein
MFENAPEVDKFAIEVIQHFRLRGCGVFPKEHPGRSAEHFHVGAMRRNHTNDLLAHPVLAANP